MGLRFRDFLHQLRHLPLRKSKCSFSSEETKLVSNFRAKSKLFQITIDDCWLADIFTDFFIDLLLEHCV